VCALPPVTFSTLNRGISRWFLAIEVVNTNWGNMPQQEQRGGRYRSHASLRREELSLRPPAAPTPSRT
jgi:hypothetical protein